MSEIGKSILKGLGELTMLTRFQELWSEVTREGADKLFEHMRNIGYFDAPASSAYHLSKRGGLLEHSVNVTETLLKMANAVDAPYTRETLIVVGLLHDIGKAAYYGKPNYIENILKSGKQSEAKPFETNKDRSAIPHEVAALHIIPQYMELTEDEAFAILYHNGLYTSIGYQLKGNESVLQILIHSADMIASRTEDK